MNLHPQPWMEPVTVRQATGRLVQPKHDGRGRRHELVDAWRKCPPGKSLRKTVPNVSSFESVRLDPDKPSTTQTNHFNWHYAAPRYVTLEETALIGSFSPGFRWPAKLGHCERQIGNSVPPLFMRAIARHIRTEILKPISGREKAA
jgi:DNA (cytosine-5)-methyltransferase 1